MSLRPRFALLSILVGFQIINAQALKQTAYIKASNTEAGDHFGSGGPLEGQGVALSGDGNTLAVGAPFESSNAKGINGNQNDNSLYSSGAVYVYTRRNGAWTQQAYIKASNPGKSARFGQVVSLNQDGSTLAVSAFYEASKARGINGDQNDTSMEQSGAVYVFVRTGANWAQQAYIKASNTGEPDDVGDGDQFGFALHISADGNTLAVGAISEDSNAKGVNGNQADNSMQSAGAVYVFTRTGTTWSQQAYLKSGNTDPGDMFGYNVSLNANGNVLAIAAYDEDGSPRTVNGTPDRGRRGSGAIYVFERTGTTWVQKAYLKASNAEANDSLGYSMAISQDGNTIAAGAADEDCKAAGIDQPGCMDDEKSDTSIGAAYVWGRSGDTWTQQAFLKASNPGVEDWFGARLAISGDGNLLAVGAQVENGGGKGINGKQDDKTAEDSGAVYLFTRTGAKWTQQAYVKGANTEAYDEFGSAMSISKDGKTIAISARSESSAAKGVNGNAADNSAKEAGAVYIFSN